MIEIDGSYLEGGGQIIRTAAALACVTGKPCRVYNIRANRPNPGLRAQHLNGLKALAELCNAKLKGATMGSTEITFEPGAIKGGEIEIRIPTAGSIGLIFQILSLPACFAERETLVKGGATYGKFAPPIDYINLVLLPLLQKLGYKASINIIKHGFYPKGGAEVEIHIEPVKKLRGISLTERGKLKEIKGVSVASELLKQRNVAERQRAEAERMLSLKGFSANIKEIYSPSLNPGSGITLVGVFENTGLGADSLGEKGKSAELVGRECAEKLVNTLQTNACLDEHAADQVLPFIAVASGESEITVSRITLHCITNAWVIEKFLPVKFEIIGERGKQGKIICRKI